MPLNNDDIKQLINILQRGLTTEEAPAPTKSRGRPKSTKKTTSKPRKSAKSAKSTKPTKTIAKKTTSRKSSKSSGDNLFDSMLEKNMFKGDIAIDKKLNKLPPSPRTRKLNMIEVRCRGCGDKNKVSTDLVIDKARYKCNKCSMTPG